ncbi:MAG: type II toxin-antitoxin system VapC family toxin [Deltaproteobacteria bacterium]|nr:type II toxin-antitoxin system VapC family toxin [Deltaproteobacteria bacterium]
MPPQASRKVIFDTNVYICAIRGGAASREYELLLASLPSTYLCSVVSSELYVGALDSRGTRLIRGFVSRSENVGRIVTPTHGSWNEAGRILAEMGRREPKYKSMFATLLNDALIAVCALQVGARVCTRNEEDFEGIRRYKRFDLEVIGGSLRSENYPSS